MKWISTYQFADAWVLWFLLIIPTIAVWYILSNKKRNTPLLTSDISLFNSISSGFLPKLKHIVFSGKLAAIALLIISLARPQLSTESDSFIEHYKEGIDIIISMDASGSMLAQDFKPDRLEASKEVAKDFISKRTNDRIGIVVFEGEAYTHCPLTSDNKIAMELLDELERKDIAQGTAIGMGLAIATNRLRESTAPSKVVILLTDGVNNAGKIHPLTAAEMAKEFGIRVYTIGVGSNGKAKMPVAINPLSGKYIYDMVDVEIDEKTLSEISDMTGGKYFRATDNDKLKAIYDEIDLLEKEKTKLIEYEVDLPEQSFPLLLTALLLLFGSFIIDSTILKSIS